MIEINVRRLSSVVRPPSSVLRKEKAGNCRPEVLGIEPYTTLGPVRPRPGGLGGLRNPEYDPDRALRQQSDVSQVSLACAGPK
jgi:hypothetical protein